MKSTVLTPIKISPKDFDDLEEILMGIFKREIYLPLLSDAGAKENVLRNSMDDLLEAFRTGQIWFWQGEVGGKFNAQVSRELIKLGAGFDAAKGRFKIRLADLPADIRIAIAAGEMKFDKALAKINQRLNQLSPDEIAGKFRMENFFDKRLFNLDKDIQKTLKNITVTPQLTDSQRARIAEGYTDNLERYIKNFTEEEIANLRNRIQKSTMQGVRYEGLIGSIKKSYGVSENKAHFLARQETNLMMQEFKKVRYQDAGSEGYFWGCVAGSPNHPVRPDHLRLKGQYILWSDPPVTNLKTGARNHAGCDFGCRCFPKVVIKF